MALLLALTMFHHLIDGFRNRDLRRQVADLLGLTRGCKKDCVSGR
jgi:hypothetical protein